MMKSAVPATAGFVTANKPARLFDSFPGYCMAESSCFLKDGSDHAGHCPYPLGSPVSRTVLPEAPGTISRIIPNGSFLVCPGNHLKGQCVISTWNQPGTAFFPKQHRLQLCIPPCQPSCIAKRTETTIQAGMLQPRICITIRALSGKQKDGKRISACRLFESGPDRHSPAGLRASCYIAPRRVSTTQTVRRRILQSRIRDQFSIYSLSS